MPSKKYTVPPYCHWEFRCSDTFYVYHGDALVGPDSSTARRYCVETAGESMELKIDTMKDAKVSTLARVRPSPFEHNSGVPAEIQQPVHEPTIQEMIRMYIAESLPETSDPETPDEFFDFDMDDEQDILTSPYEFEEMEEDFRPEPESTEGDSQESPDTKAEPEADVKQQSEQNTPLEN